MEFKLAKADLHLESKTANISEIEALLKVDRENIFYFEKENSEKNLTKLEKHFKDRGYSTYMREIKFGLDDNDKIYELHII